MSCDICWKIISDFDIDTEFDSDEFVICSECRSNNGNEFVFEKF